MSESGERPGGAGPSPRAGEEIEATAPALEETSRPEGKHSTAPPLEAPGTGRGPHARGPRSPILALGLILCGVLALWSGSHREPWGDEVQEALTLREMATASDWRALVFPGTGGEPRLATPPLYEWLAEGARRALAPLGAPSLVAYRVPVVLCALLGVWLTFLLGRGLFDRRVGFLGSVLHGTTALFFFDAARIGPELVFATGCELAAVGFALGALPSELEAAKPSRLWRAFLWIGIAVAALSGAVLVAFVLVVVPFLLAAYFRGGLHDVRTTWRRAMGGGLWLLTFLIAGPWFVAAGLEHGELLWRSYMLEGHLGLGSAEGPPGFLQSYPVVFILGFLPWTFFVPLGIFHGKDRTSRPGQRALIFWAVGAAALLLLVPPHDSSYLLYLWPPLALLIPAALYEELEVFSVWEGFLLRGTVKILPSLLRLPLYLTIGVAALWFADALPKIFGERFADALEDSHAMGIVLALWGAGGIASWFLARRVERFVAAEERAVALFESARAALFFLFVAQLSAPVVDRAQSAKFFIEDVHARLGNVPIASYGPAALHELDYYLDGSHKHFPELDPTADVGSPEDEQRKQLEAFLRRDETVYLLSSKRAFEGLEIQFPGLRGLLHDTGIEGWMGTQGRWVIFSNRELATKEKTEDKTSDSTGGETGKGTDTAPPAESGAAKPGTAKPGTTPPPRSG